MFSKGRIIVAGAVAAAACALTACGGGSGSAASTPPAAGSSRPAAPAATSSGSGLDTALRATANSTLGPIVVDGAGRTLYRFDKDTASPPASNCEGACAKLWPPVLVGTQLSLTGVNQALLGTIKRADGTVQLTLHGWPLYRYAGDSAPGDVNGEGVGGVWFAVRPTGAKALPASSASNSNSSTSNSNSGNSSNNENSTGSSGGYGY
jgi:predicted lipoprotein with Yx(FWY)xxD motif